MWRYMLPYCTQGWDVAANKSAQTKRSLLQVQLHQMYQSYHDADPDGCTPPIPTAQVNPNSAPHISGSLAALTCLVCDTSLGCCKCNLLLIWFADFMRLMMSCFAYEAMPGRSTTLLLMWLVHACVQQGVAAA